MLIYQRVSTFTKFTPNITQFVGKYAIDGAYGNGARIWCLKSWDFWASNMGRCEVSGFKSIKKSMYAQWWWMVMVHITTFNYHYLHLPTKLGRFERIYINVVRYSTHGYTCSPSELALTLEMRDWIRHWDYDYDHEERTIFRPISRTISPEKSRHVCLSESRGPSNLMVVWCSSHSNCHKSEQNGLCEISQFWCIQDKIDSLGRQQNQLAAEAAQLQSSFSLKQMQEIWGRKSSNIFQMGNIWKHGNDMERYGVLSYPR